MKWLNIFFMVAFMLLVAIFVHRLVDYHRSVTEWSRRELTSRAEQAALVLAEPLRTLDLPKVRAVGEQFGRDDLRLRIVHGANDVTRFLNGAGFYDTGATEDEFLFGLAASGEYQVGVGRSLAAIERPFRLTLFVVVLAGLVGTAGMLLYFSTVWRQRMRLRELTRLERFRRDFIADLSHEFKTPLTGIVMAADMLREATKGNSQTERLAEMMKGSADRLQHLAQDVQELARLENDADVFNPRPTDLNALVASCVDSHRLAADRDGVVLTLERFNGSAMAKVDPDLLSMAVSNLIGNALRHSNSPEVIVRLKSAGRGWSVEVEDHGVGIPAEAAGRVFERFYRVDPSRTGSSGGSGLGLAIVDGVAKLHGGNVTCHQANPRGTVFVLNFYS